MAWMPPPSPDGDLPPWSPFSSDPPRPATPYGYSARDVARVAYALDTFPRATDRPRRRTGVRHAKATGFFRRAVQPRRVDPRAQRFGGDPRRWLLILLALARRNADAEGVSTRATELSHPVRRHAAAFSAEEIVVVVCAYERCTTTRRRSPENSKRARRDVAGDGEPRAAGLSGGSKISGAPPSSPRSSWETSRTAARGSMGRPERRGPHGAQRGRAQEAKGGERRGDLTRFWRRTSTRERKRERKRRRTARWGR